MTIPTNIAAKVLFISDRTCCVCRNKGKPVQIHHIDEDNTNNDITNLAVLCLDCHTETQIKGGFHRKLNTEQIILYRDDWLDHISRERRLKKIDSSKNIDDSKRIDLITSVAENLRENEEYEMLSVHYNIAGNEQLRDKYIEMAINSGATEESIIYLRKLQNRVDLIPKELIDKRINGLVEVGSWNQLGRLYRDIEDYEKATYYYCKNIMDSLDNNNPFSAAYYLKEMNRYNFEEPLFEMALEKATKEEDIWWQYRALTELGWTAVIKDFVISNKESIKNQEI